MCESKSPGWTDGRGHQGGFSHYALTSSQQNQTESRPDERETIARRARSALAAFNGGQAAAEGSLTHPEALIRTSSEDDETLWDFSVAHFAKDSRQVFQADGA